MRVRASLRALFLFGAALRGSWQVDVAVAGGMATGRDDIEVVAVHLPFFKATRHTEGDERFIYCEASNEGWDQESDSVLMKALMGSSNYFVQNGNIDVDHVTLLGHRMRMESPHLYEIGLPVEVRRGDHSVLVKGRLYQGPSRVAKVANEVWESLELGSRWFPSVAGDKRGVKKVLDPTTGMHKSIITDVLWKNLALSKQPQNLSVPAVSVLGFDEFAKGVLLGATLPSADGEPCARSCCKAVTALPASTDVGARTGGAALTGQSLEGAHDQRYQRVAAQYLRDLGTGACAHTLRPTRAALEDHFQACGGMDAAAARKAAERLLHDVSQRTRQAA